MTDFVRRHGLDEVPHVADVDGQVWAANGVAAQPAWVFVDGDGTGAVTRSLGALDAEGLRARLNDLSTGDAG